MIQLHFPPKLQKWYSYTFLLSFKNDSVTLSFYKVALRFVAPLVHPASSLRFFTFLLHSGSSPRFFSSLLAYASSLRLVSVCCFFSSLLVCASSCCCQRFVRIFNIAAFSESNISADIQYCGNCKKRWGDLLDFLFKKVGVPMFWNRGPVKVPLPLSDEKQGGGEESFKRNNKYIVVRK